MKIARKILSLSLCGVMALSMVGCEMPKTRKAKEEDAKSLMVDAWNEVVNYDFNGTGVEIGDDNSYICIDTNPEDKLTDNSDEVYHYIPNLEKIYALLDFFEFNDAVKKKINETSVFDSEQTAETDTIKLTWSYSPGTGIEAMFEINIK